MNSNGGEKLLTTYFEPTNFSYGGVTSSLLQQLNFIESSLNIFKPLK
jgi:hypothetical protein